MRRRICRSARGLESRFIAGLQDRRYTVRHRAKIKPCCDVPAACWMRIQECSGTHRFHWIDKICTNVPASHFLRPCSGQLGKAHPLHLKMIKRNMTRAAKKGRGYHLWWHPHNFGQDIDANINALKQILSHFTLCMQNLEWNLATWPGRRNENNGFRTRWLIHIYSSQLAGLQDRQPLNSSGKQKEDVKQ